MLTRLFTIPITLGCLSLIVTVASPISLRVLIRFVLKILFIAYAYSLWGLLFTFFSLGLSLSHQFASTID